MCKTLKESQMNIHFDKLISNIPKEKYISLNFHALFCTVCSRISKIMSCEKSAIFFQKIVSPNINNTPIPPVMSNLVPRKTRIMRNVHSYVLYVSTYYISPTIFVLFVGKIPTYITSRYMGDIWKCKQYF